jgi:diguanylate cyclase
VAVEGRARAESGTPALLAGLAGVALLALHALGLLGPLDGLTFVGLAAGTIVAVTYGVVRYRPKPRWVWLMGLTALMLFFVGGVLRSLHNTLADLSPARSWLPEPFSLLGYVALGAMLYGVARARLGPRWRDPDATLDAVIAGLAALALAWIYLMTPALDQEDVPFAVSLALVLYPALSIFLVTIGFRIAFNASRQPPLAFRFLLLGLLATLIGDAIYMLVELHLVGNGRWVDLSYGLAYVAVIVAALHPSMARITEPPPSAELAPRRGLALVAIAVCVPGIVTLAQPETDTSDRAVLALIVLGLMAAAGVRVFHALRDHARSEARLSHQATHDSLTGLPNRAFLEAHLADLMDERTKGDPPLAILFLDLDRFKLVNDTLGHAVGDELLRSVARRLVDNVRPNDLVARIGGDEFVVVLPEVRDEVEARRSAERTRLTFATPFKTGDADITISTSIGLTLAEPGVGQPDPGTMLREADTAMYAAKDAGGDAASFFDDAMHQRVTRRLALEGEIRLAAERRELSLHYQPIVQVADHRITGLEALMRWEHPTLGQVPPSDFIPVCEEIGYIVELGAWAIDEAVGQLATLRAELPHSEQLSMAINVSPRQLRDDRLCDHVARALVKYSLSPSSLCIEVTETLLVENLSAISATLATLRSFGVRIAIDDFGTGYSSLSYLRHLPVDEIKIDQQFTSSLGQDRADDTLVAAILAMANSLGCTSVAEGVETETQLNRLIELGCEHAQGYSFGVPVPADKLGAMVDRLGLAAAPRLKVVRDPA